MWTQSIRFEFQMFLHIIFQILCRWGFVNGDTLRSIQKTADVHSPCYNNNLFYGYAISGKSLGLIICNNAIKN